jgi:hypothetical protein
MKDKELKLEEVEASHTQSANVREERSVSRLAIAAVSSVFVGIGEGAGPHGP